jgi:hypothetical protein
MNLIMDIRPQLDLRPTLEEEDGAVEEAGEEVENLFMLSKYEDLKTSVSHFLG